MKHTARGFTLIELIVAFALSITLAFVGVLGFVQFNTVQKFNNSVNDLETLMQKAKSYSISQVKPKKIAACANNPLGGYEVRLCGLAGSSCAGIGVYNLYVICGNANLLESGTLPEGVTYGNVSTTSFVFQILNGSATAGTIEIMGAGRTKTISVSANGIVSIQ